MRRFSRLEFGDRPEEGKDQSRAGEEVRDAEYFHKQAVRYWLGGDFELALRNYSRALEQNSAFYPGWLGQVLMLIELGEYKEALVWTDKALEMFPEHPELLSAKTIACVRDGRVEKAIAYSDNSITKDNVTPRVWLARAEIFLKRKGSVAQNCISKAVTSAGSEDALIVRLEAGRLLNQNGDYATAMQYLRTLVDELPKSALAWYELGRAQAGLGRDEAKSSFEQALKFHPDWDIAEEALRKFSSRGFFGKLFGR
jgi:tetratricopeptide (TPR) repeat protein